ncbi:MAG: DUF1501 domain-containing protein [Pseudomonadota bacterium]
MRKTNRRQFLRQSVALASAGGLLPSLMNQQALAADTSGYKALVCVFFFGGIDNNDVLIPRDAASYGRFANTRANLLTAYAASATAGSRERLDLIPVNPLNSGVFGGLEFGLPEELEPLSRLFNSGEAAIVGGVGPLIEPITRTQFEAGTGIIPNQLFSHNDQQSTWMALGTEGSKIGWGGRFMDQISQSDPSLRDDFVGVTAAGNNVFLNGSENAVFAISPNGPASIELLTNRNILGSSSDFDATRALLEAQWTAQAALTGNVFADDYRDLQAAGITVTEQYAEIYANRPTLSTQLNANGFEAQLRAVAEMISVRDQLNTPRQVYFVGIGGFDTHADQAGRLTGLQRTLANGIEKFRDAMVELGAWNDVTLFTAADFGRTLNDNGDGTDHGWGGHHFVAGGSVRGQRVYGGFPDSDTQGPNYTDDRGRLIPSVSVEQYASTLGAWFGLTPAERRAALPNLVNFSSDDLGFMQL